MYVQAKTKKKRERNKNKESNGGAAQVAAASASTSASMSTTSTAADSKGVTMSSVSSPIVNGAESQVSKVLVLFFSLELVESVSGFCLGLEPDLKFNIFLKEFS